MTLIPIFVIALTFSIIYISEPAFGQTANEIDIAAGAGASATADCVSVNNCFSPNPMNIQLGATVTWVNNDQVGHTITSGKPGDNNMGSLFDSDLIKSGNTFQFTFANAGIYDYFCSIHPWMTGQVIVSAVATGGTTGGSQTGGTSPAENSPNNSTLSYAVFFITENDTCTDSEYKSLKFYQVIADEYLTLYKIPHDLEGSLCVPLKNYQTYFSGLSTFTLPIVIADNTVGQQLVQQGYYGLYEISGTGRQAVYVCSCDSDIESWTGAWVLSHELSHFALHYLGEPDTISVDWVHYIQALVNSCEEATSSKSCQAYSTIVTSPSGNQIPVMEIFGQDSTSYKIPSNPPQSEITIISKHPIPTNPAYTTNHNTSIFSDAQRHTDSNTYWDINHTFSIQPPLNWTVLNSISPSVSNQAIVTFSNNDKNQLATFGIYHRYIGQNVIDAINSHSDNDILTTITQEMANGNSDSQTVVLNGVVDRYNDGIRVTVSSTTRYTSDNATSLSENIIYFLNNGNQYTLDLTTNPNSINKNSQLFEDSARSFLVSPIEQVTVGSGGQPIPTPSSSSQIPMKNYINHEYNFSISYPSDWAVQENYVSEANGNVGIVKFQSDPSATSYFSINGKVENMQLLGNQYLNKMVQDDKDFCSSFTFARDQYTCEFNLENATIHQYNGLTHYIVLAIQDWKAAPNSTGHDYNEFLIDDNIAKGNDRWKLYGSVDFNDSSPDAIKKVTDHVLTIYQSFSSFTILETNQSRHTLVPQAFVSATTQDIVNINEAKNDKTIAAEVNIGSNQAETKSIDSSITVRTNNTSQDSVNVIVSASNQTGPKVLLFNLGNTTINIGNLKYLGIMYDGKPIQPASDVNSLLHGKSTDDPKYAIIITQSGAQILILVPHFSTHTITITNMSKVIPAIPEFPFAILILIIATFSIVLISRMRRSKIA